MRMVEGSTRWQIRLLPLMSGIIIATAIFFASAAVWKIGSIENRINREIKEPQEISFSGTVKAQSFGQQITLARTQAAYSLEREALARRYNQAEIAFSLRLWTRFMGFVTGMILALVGAAFVLGKLETSINELGGNATGISFSLRSASPGVVLAVLGTVLMGISIVVPATAVTSEKAVYFSNGILPYEESTSDGPPENPPIESASPSEPDLSPVK
jgi:hypothetical protein